MHGMSPGSKLSICLPVCFPIHSCEIHTSSNFASIVRKPHFLIEMPVDRRISPLRSSPLLLTWCSPQEAQCAAMSHQWWANFAGKVIPPNLKLRDTVLPSIVFADFERPECDGKCLDLQAKHKKGTRVLCDVLSRSSHEFTGIRSAG